MAILHFDSFQTYGTLERGLANVYELVSGAAIVAASAAHGNRPALGGGIGYVRKTLPAAPAYHAGVRAWMPAPSGNIQTAMFFADGGSVQVFICIETTGAISARLGSTTGPIIAQSAPGVFVTGGYISALVTVHNTLGAVTLKQNGVTLDTQTNIDTQNTPNAQITGVACGANVGGALYFTDFYIGDTTGSAPENAPLDNAIANYYPASAAGGSAQWTPLAGSNHENVDEAAGAGPDDDTTYNSTTTIGHADAFAITPPALPSDATVLAVRTVLRLRNDSVGAPVVTDTLKAGATTHDGTGHATTAAYVTKQGPLRTVNPTTAAPWERSELDTLAVGYRYTS